MTLEQALREVRAYDARRKEIRATLIAFLRKNSSALSDSERRKVVNFPSDLGDARLASLVALTQGTEGTDL